MSEKNTNRPGDSGPLRCGLVVRNTGAHYVVEPDDGGPEVNCRIKGNFRIKGIRTTNPVAVGDRVAISAPGPDGTSFITAIEPRRNYIIRRSSNLSKAAHIIGANIDQAMLVVTLAHPTTSTTFIDRFLATAEAYNIPAIIAINKIDLLTDPDDRELLEGVTYLYRSIGYKVVHLSARTGEGVDKLLELLEGKITLLSGNSGVGKSTLINDLIPGTEQRTAEISAAHDQGMHTTTFSEMFRLPDGGRIIDTPGVRGFGTVEFDRHEVAHYFPEIFATGKDCRFGNCTHTGEPGCAVREAVEDCRIAASRYASYLNILTEDASGADEKYRK
ncbi:MAG: ribosome small subunit-dependent GTPase A [Muribaculaceae bacterium]|nr:ribosome small subunit-dependent GTPase A [Muribaculaceae bacterium]